MQQLGKYIVLTGLIIVVVGVVVWLAGDKLRWLGHLPGDIHIDTENVKVFIPITTMILISIVFSAILWIIRRLM